MLAHTVEFAPNLGPDAVIAQLQVDYRAANDSDWTLLPDLAWNLVGDTPAEGIEVRFDAGLLGKTYELRMLATDALGNVVTDEASVYYSHLDFTGWTGDVITLDLSQRGAHREFESVSATAGGFGVLTNLDDVTFADSGVAYVVPDPDFSGSVVGDFVLQGETFTFELEVSPGYSASGKDRVQPGATQLDVHRLQQRLRYLGYPGANGEPLALTGAWDADTSWAAGLFSAAMTGAPHTPSASNTRWDLLNESDAVSWVELAGPEGQVVDGYVILPNLDGGPQSERWGTRWLQELLTAAGNYASNDPLLQVRAASLRQGGDSSFHTNEGAGAHDGGLHLDLELPSSNSPEAPFFATTEINGIRYVSAGGNLLVYYQPATQTYVAADPSAVGSLADAVRAEASSDPSDPRRAWDNRTVLLAIRPFLQDNAAIGYDHLAVRRQIEALVNAATTSGAAVDAIYFNDPRTWGGYDAANQWHWNGDGVNGSVRFARGANPGGGNYGPHGVMHVAIKPPVRDSTLTVSQGNSLQAGLQAFATRLGELASLEEFGANIPLVEQALGDAFDLPELISASVIKRVQDYFAQDATPTTQELTARLRQINYFAGGVSASVNPSAVAGGLYRTDVGEELRFSVALTASRTEYGVPLDLGSAGDQLGLLPGPDATVDLNHELKLDFAFGYALGAASASDPFFVRIAELSTSSRVDASSAQFALNVGLLGAQAADVQIRLDAELEAQFAPPNVARTITRGELEQSELSALADVSQVRSVLDATLPLSAELGDYSTAGKSPELKLQAFELFSGAGLSIDTSADFGELRPFANLSSEAIKSMLFDLEHLLFDLGQKLPQDQSLPFLAEKSTSNLWKLERGFRDRMRYQAYDYASSDEANGEAQFQTLQELVALLDGSSDVALVASYAPAAAKLTFAIDIDRTLDVEAAALDLPWWLEGLNGLETSNFATLETSAEIGLDWGIDLELAGAPVSKEHFYVDNLVLGADARIAAEQIDLSGRFYGLGVTSTGGEGSADVQVELTGWDERIYLDAPRPTVTADLSGSADFTLASFRPQPKDDGTPLFETHDADPSLPAARIVWTDVAFDATRDVEFLGDWTCFYAYQTVAYEHFVDALAKTHQMLQTAASSASAAASLPAINQPLTQLIDFTNRLGVVVAELQQQTPTNVVQGWEQRLEERLIGSGLQDVAVDLDFSCEEIVADVRFAVPIPDQWAPLNASTGSQSIVQANSNGQLYVTSTADVAIVFGVDLRDKSNPRPFLDDDSYVHTTVGVSSPSPLSGKVAVGPLGAWVNDGVALLDIDGKGPSVEPAKIDLNVVDNDGDERHYFDASRPLASDLRWQRQGQAFVQLPLYFPTETLPLGGVDADSPSDADSYPENQLVVEWNLATLSTPNVLESPDLQSVIDGLSLLDDPSVLLAGLESALQLLHSKLNSGVFGAQLPLVGKALQDAVTFVSDVQQAVDAEIKNAGALTSAVIKQALYNALGPSGLGLLANINQIAIPVNSSQQIEFAVPLAKTLPVINVPIDVGVPGLNLTGDVGATVSYQWNLGFGISKTDGFYLKDAPGDELTLDVNVSAAGLQAAGTLGFVTVAATADDTTGLTAGVGIDLKDVNSDGKLQLAELGGGVFDAKMSATAEARAGIQLVGTFAGDSAALFPSIRAKLIVDWNLANANPTGQATSFGAINVRFENVGIDAGSVVSKLLAPMFDRLNQALDPIRPVIDFFSTRIPIVSDFDPLRSYYDLDANGEVTMIEVVSVISGDARPAQLVQTLEKIVEFTDRFRALPTGELWVNVGAFDFGALDPRGPGFNLTQVQPNGTTADPLAQSNPATNLIRDAQQTLRSEDGRGFRLTLLENPSNIFRLLLGQDVDVFQYDLPLLQGEVTAYGPEFAIFPPLMGRFGGVFNYFLDVGIGFDTTGLRAFEQSGFTDYAAIFDGFYIADRAGPEVKLGGDLRFEGYAGGDLSLFPGLDVTASGGLVGKLGVESSFEINDVDSDGKVRAREFQQLLNGGIFCLFETDGRIYVSAEAFLKVTARAEACLLGKCVTKSWDVFDRTWLLADVTLVEFDFPCETTTQEPARLENGVLLLQTSEGNDGITVVGIGPGAVRVASQFGSREYSGFTRIEADGLGGDDVIRLANVDVPATLRGGEGNDSLSSTGSATVSLFGDGGNDRLYGGDGNDVLEGGDGDDLLDAGAGLDVLRGGNGNDVLYGGLGDDSLYGEAGDDQLEGGGGNDSLYGEAGDDVLVGGDGNDRLFGGDDHDSLVGGKGNDRLEGGDGNDALFGTEGANVLLGQAGDDRLFGGIHNDELYGQEGADVLRGNQGNDALDGGDGNDDLGGGDGDDTLLGGAGDDDLQGNSGNDTLRGGAGGDFIYGGAGNDTLFGGDDDDRLDGGSGDDKLYGEAGNDKLYGQAGVDRLEGGLGDDLLDGGVGADVLLAGAGNDLAYGGDGDDQIDVGDGNNVAYGGVGNDVINAGVGDDRLYGEMGDDRIRAGDGANYVEGGDGNDLITAGTGSDRLYGGRGDDQIDAGAGNNAVYGGAGRDVITAGAGNDALHGDDGDDQITAGDGVNVVYGGAGNDVITSGSGGDRLYGEADDDHITAGGGDDVVLAGAGNDTVYGGDGNDQIDAEDGDNFVYGQDGDDTIYSGAGEDHIEAGAGNDVVWAGDGRDIVHGQLGDDTLHGEGGDDRLFGGAGQDTLFGGDGNDWLEGAAGNDQIDGGDGHDLLFGHQGDDGLAGGAGADILAGGEGNDTLEGGDGDDLLQGAAGDDLLRGDDGNDRLLGEEGVDRLEGGDGDDYLDAGAGVGNLLYGEAGDDILVGSDEGADVDPDFFDDVHFGDRLDGGLGNDVIYALGGADFIDGGPGRDRIEAGRGSDYVLGGDDDDWIYAGPGLGDLIRAGAGDDVVYGSPDGNDQLYGDQGRDQLFGQGGDDQLVGGDGHDRLDGGAGTDRLAGDAGNDHLFGGGGNDDQLLGGDGDDALHGSDDGADVIRGGPGQDLAYGYGGNDVISGDEGDDQLFGGDGDDLLLGAAGRDLLVGGAHHDTLYGHHDGGAHAAGPDDGATDYLYGDFATNGNEPRSGRDRLFGGNGNDELFGEGEDDLIVPGGGGDNRVYYGSGESAVPGNFVPPAATPPPNLAPATNQTFAEATLPTGPDYRGRWAEFAGSASGRGVSNHPSAAQEPSVAVAADGSRYLAWVDHRSGVSQVYVARHTDAGGWQQLGGSAEGGGLSRTTASARRPALMLDASGAPVVAWTEITTGGSFVHVLRWNATAQQWSAMGPAERVATSGAADQPALALSASGLVLAWIDAASGVANAHLRRFDGATWQPLAGSASGGGVSQSTANIAELQLSADGARIALAWTQPVGDVTQVYAKQFVGGAWQPLAGSSAGAGLSQSTAGAYAPTIAWHAGQLFAGWLDRTVTTTEIGPLARLARYDGVAWRALDAAPSSLTSGPQAELQLAAGGGRLHVAWKPMPQSGAAHVTLEPVYVAAWTGTSFAASAPSDAAGSGVHPTGTAVEQLALLVDGSGRPYLAWQEQIPGAAPWVALRGDARTSYAADRVFVATGAPGQTVADLLTLHALGAGDAIVIDGSWGEQVTLGPAHAGVALLGAPGSQLDGSLTVAANDVLVQGVRLEGNLLVTGENFTLRESQVGAATLVGAPDPQLVHSTFTELRIEGGQRAAIERNQFGGLVLDDALDVLVRFNRIASDGVGIELATASTGRIEHNIVSGADVGLRIAASFVGAISENEIRESAVGVQYDAQAPLSGNRIVSNAIGVAATVSDPAAALGFAADAAPNDITGNQVGVELTGRMQGQRIHANELGVTGEGLLGGDDLQRPNEIVGNGVGVEFAGVVQYNRIGSNGVGVKAQSHQQILHNLIYRNAEQGVLVDGVERVQIVGNTFYAPSGDNVRIVGAAQETEVRNNILWAEQGYNLYVANDSRSGFFSDYNLLHTTGAGKVAFWGEDFADVLDWQEDVHLFDLHSRGTTVVNPEWSNPRFVDLGRDDYRIVDLTASQRFTSPARGAADRLADAGALAALPVGVPGSAPLGVNLLANPSFEEGLGGWTTHVQAGVRSESPAAHQLDNYFASGDVAVGEARQTISLATTGFSPAAIDAGRLVVTFGGRVRSAAEAAPDQGEIVLELLNASGAVLASASTGPLTETGRWELAGGEVALVPGTRSLRYSFTSSRRSGATSDAYLDAAFVRVADEAYGPDLGAYAASPAAPGPAGQARLALRFPDLHVDWQRGEPRDIRWDAYNHPATALIRIDLYQDGPDGPARFKTIAANAPNSGSYTWTPADSDVPYGTYDLRIQVSRVDDPLVFDRSTETFAVPEQTLNYYVNDRDQTGDALTTAPGDNRHTGARPDQPKPNPINLLRIYTLGATNVLHVDGGEYALHYPVLLSGTLGVGDDEGFTMTGSPDAAAPSALRHLLPETVAPLIDLNDADFVTLRRLTLNDAQYGVLARNDSTQLAASHLVFAGHTADGLRIEADSSAGVLSHLVASGNGGAGVFLAGSFGALTDSVISDNAREGVMAANSANAQIERNAISGNAGHGIVATNAANARIEANVVSGNARDGLVVTGAGAVVGHADLSLERGNRVVGNLQDGIDAGSGVLVVGNVVSGHTNADRYGIVLSGAEARHNVVHGNFHGLSASGTAVANRVYDHLGRGIDARGASMAQNNVVYSNDIGVFEDGSSARLQAIGNVIYANETAAINVRRGSTAELRNNTIYQPTGDGIVLAGDMERVVLRSNIVVVGAGTAVSVARETFAAFASDFNLLQAGPAGAVGRWGTAPQSTLAQWQLASFGDPNSLAADPLFVDPDGADEVLGFAAGVAAGFDDDFHLRSLYGRSTGALAPILAGGSGWPYLPPATTTIDAQQSPAIDRGDDATPVGAEPVPNGGFVNLGAFGGTEFASRSSEQYLLVTSPNGGQSWSAERTHVLRWRSDTLAADGPVRVDVELIRDGDPSFLYVVAAAAPNSGSFAWSMPNDPDALPPGDDYRVRVRRTDDASLVDVSDAPLKLTPPISAYYVNDGDATGDRFTLAPGDDAQNGLSPAAPKASIRGVLQAYALQPGDVIYVDSGYYRIDQNLVLDAALSGVRIEGPGGGLAVLDRANDAAGSYLFELAGADDVTLKGLALTGAEVAVMAPGGVDSDRVTLEGNALYGNRGAGVRVDGSGGDVEGWQIVANRVYDHSSGSAAISVLRAEALIRDNEVFGNARGIYLDGPDVLAVGNLVYDHAESGIYIQFFGVARGNVVRDNNVGVYVWYASYGVLLEDNRLYGNDYGVRLENRVQGSPGRDAALRGNEIYANRVGVAGKYFRGTLQANRLYANDVGIVLNDSTAEIAHNLLYAHANHAVVLSRGDATTFVNNTVYQSVGDALRLEQSAENVVVANNIFWVDAGAALRVAADSQVGFRSDYNLLHVTGTGQLARWGDVDVPDYATWRLELGFDVHSRLGDPLFVDRDGADFRLRPGSPGIDGGDPTTPVGAEPAPAGGRINLGAYGGTALAAPSPAPQNLHLLSPNGLDKFSAGQTVDIRWLADLQPPVLQDAAAYAETVRRQQPLAYFPLHEAPGETTPIDALGRLTGAYVGLPSANASRWAAAQPDAVGFDANGYLEIGPADPAELNGDATFSFWIRPSANDGSRRFFALGGLTASTSSTPTSARFGANWTTRSLTQFTLELDRWQHVAAVIDRAAGRITVYRDGTAVGSGSLTDFLRPGDASQPLQIGRLSGLDDVVVYSRALSASEIAAQVFNAPYHRVDLHLYDAEGYQPGVSTPVRVIADDLLAAGAYQWLVPSDGSVPVDRQYLIEVRSAASPQVRDASDRPVLIANAGHAYYVNDAAALGDVFTSAPGDNLRSGKTPDQPLASLNALLQAYALQPGDVIYVDSGYYRIDQNLVLDAALSGVRIEGPGGGLAVLDRANDAAGSYLFELAGADDVTLKGLALTGAEVAVMAPQGVDSDRVTLEGNALYGNRRNGVRVVGSGGDVEGWQIVANRAYDHGGRSGGEAAISVTNAEALIRDNEVFGNYRGIYLDGPDVLAVGNLVYDHAESGIYIQSHGVARGNVVRDNNVGVSVWYASYGVLLEDNRLYGNDYGVRLENRVEGSPGRDAALRGNEIYANRVGVAGKYFRGTLQANRLYANDVGIELNRSTAEIAHNLLYAHANHAVVLVDSRGDATTFVVNNTVYQSVGDALRLEQSAEWLVPNVVVANNIFWVEAGAALRVAADSQVGFRSDYNLFRLSADPNARVGQWDGQDAATLAEWQSLATQDAHSLIGDPGFLDIDGADNVLGYRAEGAGYNGGADDNFYQVRSAIGIDRGASWAGPLTDLAGTPRRDDPGTPNAGSPEYFAAVLPSAPFALAGTPRNWRSDNNSWTADLPFAFPFYGGVYSSVQVSSKGFLQFAGPNGAYGDNSPDALIRNARIAPLWDDLSTAPTGKNIYWDATTPGQLTIGWDAVLRSVGGDVRFSVTLWDTGDIEFHYGGANASLTPTVGISAGDGRNYQFAAYDGRVALNNAPPLRFSLAPGVVDIGAYEFPGKSNDLTPPTVVGSLPAAIDAQSAANGPLEEFTLQLSEPLNVIDARASAAYSLLAADEDGIFGTLDDRLVGLTPHYVAGTTLVTLRPTAPLTDGKYRLTLFGDSTLHDLAGLRLDGNGDGAPRGNYVREFSVTTDATQPGDFDGDGAVGAEDLALWSAEFGTVASGAPLAGDADGDNDVDGFDFLAWQRNYGVIEASAASTAAAVTAPANFAEPAASLGPEAPGSMVATAESGPVAGFATAPNDASPAATAIAAGDWGDPAALAGLDAAFDAALADVYGDAEEDHNLAVESPGMPSPEGNAGADRATSSGVATARQLDQAQDVARRPARRAAWNQIEPRLAEVDEALASATRWPWTN